MSEKIKNIFIIFTILIAGFIFQKNYTSDFPNYTHAWAQSDHYALSLGFVDNGLNFTKPQTKVLNHQFPNLWLDESNSSITAVDFPIHDFIPAVIMKMTGSKSPLIFRMYILFYSFLGLFFLFKLTELLTNDFYKSIFVVVFAATSPIFIYYQNGFLPTIPSLTNTIIGIYCYVNYLQKAKNKSFAWAIFFLTFAALSRMTFIIPLIALIGLEFIRVIIYKVPFKNKIIIITLSLICLVFNSLYNNYLRNEYGSLFLNHLLMPKDLGDLWELVKETMHNWHYQYFSKIHYLITLILIILAGFFIFCRKLKMEKVQQLLLAFTLIYLTGCMLFAFAMLRQFPAHDYYFLDTFYFPFILLVILLITVIPVSNSKVINTIKIGGLLLISILWIKDGLQTQQTKRITGDWDRTTAAIKNYTEADQFLDSLHIPKDAKILALDVSAPNIPFILMNRKGYSQMKNSYYTLKTMISWDVDYVVYENEYFMTSTFNNYPNIINILTKIGDNGRISICKVNKVAKYISLSDFLGLNKENIIKEETLNFENMISKGWSNVNKSKDKVYKGVFSNKLVSDQVCGITFKSKDIWELKKSATILAFQSFINYNTSKNFDVVVSITENGSLTYYKSIDLAFILNRQHNWQKVNLYFYLPKVEADHYEFSFYIINKDKGELYLDDLKFQLFYN